MHTLLHFITVTFYISIKKPTSSLCPYTQHLLYDTLLRVIGFQKPGHVGSHLFPKESPKSKEFKIVVHRRQTA